MERATEPTQHTVDETVLGSTLVRRHRAVGTSSLRAMQPGWRAVAGSGRRSYGARVRARRRREGLTLLQAAAAVAIIGCLLAAFVPAFVRELRLSKVAEASRQLERMHVATSAYFATPRTVEGEELRRCLPDAAGPFPTEPTEDARLLDFEGEGLSRAGFTAIGFTIDEPIRFAYSLTPTVSGCDLHSPDGTYLVSYRAEGDLDGDGERSLFERRDRALDTEDVLEPVGILYIRDRTE